MRILLEEEGCNASRRIPLVRGVRGCRSPEALGDGPVGGGSVADGSCCCSGEARAVRIPFLEEEKFGALAAIFRALDGVVSGHQRSATLFWMSRRMYRVLRAGLVVYPSMLVGRCGVGARLPAWE